jgi:hypothetical protein
MLSVYKRGAPRSQHGAAGSVPQVTSAWVIHDGADGATYGRSRPCPVSRILARPTSEPGRHRPAVQHPADPGQLDRSQLGRLALAGGAHPSRTAIAPAAYQRLAVCTDTPSSPATSARVLPWVDRSAACSRRRSNHCRSPGCLSTRPLGMTAARLMPGSITHPNHQLPRSSVAGRRN